MRRTRPLDQVAKTYPATVEGDTAAILSATCLRRLGKLAEAEALLQAPLPSVPEGQMKQIAKMSLAETLRLEKKFDEALKLVDEIEKAPTPILSKDTLLIEGRFAGRSRQDRGIVQDPVGNRDPVGKIQAQ